MSPGNQKLTINLGILTKKAKIIQIQNKNHQPKNYYHTTKINIKNLNVLLLQEKGVQIHTSECSQDFTFTKNMDRSFILCSTLPTQWTV
jgi:hypothetical protein